MMYIIHSRYTLVVFLVWMLLNGFQSAISKNEANNSYQQPEMRIVGGYGCKSKIKVTPEDPNMEDEVLITFYLEAPYKSIPEFRVEFKLLKGAEFISGEKIYTHPPLMKGETAEFSIKVKIVSRLLQVSAIARAHIPDRFSGDEWGYTVGAADVDMVALAKDDIISYEKFGDDPELWSRIGPEYQYDILGGFRKAPLGHVAEEVKEIRAEIGELKKLDPTLSDWDALELLHDAVYEMVVRYGIHRKEESIPILIKARKLAREKGLSKWEAVDKIVNEIQKKKGRIDFFRRDNGDDVDYSNSNNFPAKQTVDITISGTIKYKKHLVKKLYGIKSSLFTG